ncbi:hypothetical protein C900_05656 [Fulvivirga imtechensis AK7]|uniref:Uncharacterized protein n=1 Tax=Fulvivirga imtechensis AK7 TaxID=1237149 RepID=L8JL55_9BACT|nr:hypothetical protein [Fulvivirga imtechensis]ELR68963.1 hypothetical protein C900_05656 [Fulvivirga imtechensis AK7]
MNSLSYRFYDEKLDLMYEASYSTNQEKSDRRLTELLQRSKLFLNVGNISCYRIEPKF